MVKIEINGQELEVPKGTMLIEAADEAGITIPRFCYHKKLSVAANCRMCLVDVEKVAKPLPACATPVTDGMKVYTQSAKAIEAQHSVMEFLLINHPLDCPICDQGGECDLQDLAMGYGNSLSRYAENKRVVADKNIGPLIATEMTRCIHCTRCVRFGQEIAGIMELGATGRGEHMRIGTYVEQTVNSEMSGNVIDLCPVGALTARPSRYHGRSWENKQVKSVAAHDCLGSNIYFETRRNKVMRVVPQENEAINEVWLSDRDRFSYTAIDSDKRVLSPMIKQGDDWKEVDWQTALNYAVEGIKLVCEQKSANQIGALISPSASIEEHFLFQKLIRGIGSNNIDHRLRQLDFSDQGNDGVPLLNVSIAELEKMNAILLVGSWVRKDQPIASHRIRKAAMSGADVMVLNPLDYDFNFPVSESMICAPADMPIQLAGIAAALVNSSQYALTDTETALINGVTPTEQQQSVANKLTTAEKGLVIIGTQAHYQYEYSLLRALSSLISKLADVTLGFLTEGANSAGACIAGCLPHKATAGATVESAGKHAFDIVRDKLAAYILFSVEPEFDCAEPGLATESVKGADFVVSFNSFLSDKLKATADVIFPISLNAETSGTYVNVEGVWQSFSGAVTPAGDTKPGWKVLRVLGNLFDLNGFDYVSSDDVLRELKTIITTSPSTNTNYSAKPLTANELQENTLQRVGYLPIYSVDAQLRHSQPLQDSADAMQAAIYLNGHSAETFGIANNEMVKVRQDNGTAQLQVVLDEGVPDHCVFIPMGVQGAEKLGTGFGAIELVKGNS
jgi:NADH-quinone oxidoreductase subunit G